MTKQEILNNFDEEIAYWNESLNDDKEKYDKGEIEFHDFKVKYFDAMARIETLLYAKNQLKELQ